MQRITRKDLQMQVDCINEELGAKPTDFYALYYANGGIGLHQISLIEGCPGVISVFRQQTKKELMNSLIAFRAGITAGRKK